MPVVSKTVAQGSIHTAKTKVKAITSELFYVYLYYLVAVQLIGPFTVPINTEAYTEKAQIIL